MANFTFNISKGRVNQIQAGVAANSPAGSRIVVVLLQTVEADDTLNNYTDLATLLAAAGNVECNFTNYARVPYTSADLSQPVIDNTANTQTSAVVRKTITAAGGTVDNTIVKALLCYDPTGASPDSGLVPMTAHDESGTTNGEDLIIPDANYFRAQDA